MWGLPQRAGQSRPFRGDIWSKTWKRNQAWEKHHGGTFWAAGWDRRTSCPIFKGMLKNIPTQMKGKNVSDFCFSVNFPFTPFSFTLWRRLHTPTPGPTHTHLLVGLSTTGGIVSSCYEVNLWPKLKLSLGFVSGVQWPEKCVQLSFTRQLLWTGCPLLSALWGSLAAWHLSSRGDSLSSMLHFTLNPPSEFLLCLS